MGFKTKKDNKFKIWKLEKLLKKDLRKSGDGVESCATTDFML